MLRNFTTSSTSRGDSPAEPEPAADTVTARTLRRRAPGNALLAALHRRELGPAPAGALASAARPRRPCRSMLTILCCGTRNAERA